MFQFVSQQIGNVNCGICAALNINSQILGLELGAFGEFVPEEVVLLVRKATLMDAFMFMLEDTDMLDTAVGLTRESIEVSDIFWGLAARINGIHVSSPAKHQPSLINLLEDSSDDDDDTDGGKVSPTSSGKETSFTSLMQSMAINTSSGQSVASKRSFATLSSTSTGSPFPIQEKKMKRAKNADRKRDYTAGYTKMKTYSKLEFSDNEAAMKKKCYSHILLGIFEEFGTVIWAWLQLGLGMYRENPAIAIRVICKFGAPRIKMIEGSKTMAPVLQSCSLFSLDNHQKTELLVAHLTHCYTTENKMAYTDVFRSIGCASNKTGFKTSFAVFKTKLLSNIPSVLFQNKMGKGFCIPRTTWWDRKGNLKENVQEKKKKGEPLVKRMVPSLFEVYLKQFHGDLKKYSLLKRLEEGWRKSFGEQLVIDYLAKSMYGGLNKPGAMFVGHVNVTLPNSEGKSKEHSMPKNRLTAEAREEKERVMCHLREYIRSEAGAALEARALAFILNNFRTKGGGEWVSQTRKQYVNYDCPKLIRVSVKTVYDTIVVPDRQWWQKKRKPLLFAPGCTIL